MEGLVGNEQVISGFVQGMAPGQFNKIGKLLKTHNDSLPFARMIKLWCLL